MLIAGCAAAEWTTVYQTDFESSPFVTGQTLGAVGGWSVTPECVSLSTVRQEADGSNRFACISGAYTMSTYRNIGDCGAGGLVRLTYDWEMLSYDPDSGIPTTYDADSGKTSCGFWTFLNNDPSPWYGRTALISANYDSSTGIGVFRAFDGPAQSGSWKVLGSFDRDTKYTISIEVNLTTQTYDVCVGGVKKATGYKFYSSDAVSSVSWINFHRRHNSGTFAIDNVKVEAQ